MKDLVFKLPEGKRPFIGVLYHSQKSALFNLEALHINEREELTLHVTSNYGRLSLSLRDKKNTQIYFYRMLEYDLKEYKEWRAYSHMKLHFGHCYMDKDELKVARTQEDKLYVLKIDTFSQS